MYEGHVLQTALYGDLNGNITGGVHDHVPPGTAYPYTEIGQFTEVPLDTHDGDGGEYTATLHIWSAAEGQKEVHTIMKEIDARLHHGTLSLSEDRCYDIEREFSDVQKDGQDADTGRMIRHGILRYRFSLEAT